ncbi:MAG TPA: hypothetical protein VNB64_10340, partial [Solirubrobacteraceae bacterium]|nr:hypothetical protein [Solirubrobacteraceae bacterium]
MPMALFAALRTAGLAAVALTAVCAGDAAARITVPAGFRVTTAATDMGRPSNLAFGRRGSLWTTSAGYSVASSDGVWTKRRGARPRQVVRGLDTALGLCWFRGELYVSHRIRPGGRLYGRVTAFAGFDGRRFRRRRVVLDRLPVGLHNVDSIVAGPGGRLYVG